MTNENKDRLEEIKNAEYIPFMGITAEADMGWLIGEVLRLREQHYEYSKRAFDNLTLARGKIDDLTKELDHYKMTTNFENNECIKVEDKVKKLEAELAKLKG